MDLVIILGGLVLGLVLLVGSGEALVRGGSGLAARLGLPSAIIGSTVIAAGTSLPELFVSVRAALGGSSAIAIGNVVGSNLYNLMLVLGGAALLFPLPASASVRRVDTPWLLGSTVALLLVLTGGVARWEGALLTAGMVGFLVVLARQPSDATDEADDAEVPPSGWWLVPGLLGVVLGAHVFVLYARMLAEAAGWSERVIGLTVVAIGTSTPEIVTSWMAAWRRDVGLALGNVVGSNIFNALGILGVTTLLQPTDAVTTALDQGALLGVTGFVVALLLLRRRVDRPAGGLLLLAAVGYTAALLGAGSP